MKIINLLTLFVLTGINVSLAQEKPHQLDSIFTKLYAEKKFSGNVLIADKGKVIFEKSYGWEDEGKKTKLTGSSIFNLASVSKQFTAAGIVLLQKQGKLSYDDLLSKFIPELQFYPGVTINSLLTHTSGLPDYMVMMDLHWDKSKVASNADVIKTMETFRPAILAEPGAEFKYSNTGYVLLASIIERVSKQSYAAFLQQQIFNPAKLKHTFVYTGTTTKPLGIATGYVRDSLTNNVRPEQLAKFDYVNYLQGVYGQGRVHATAKDLLIWDRFLYTNKLFVKEDKDKMFSSQQTSKKRETDYGYGWMTEDNKLYGQIVYHSGSWPGFVTYLEREIGSDKTIIILQNNSRAVIPTRAIRKILFNLPADNRITVDTLSLKRYAGSYQQDKGKPTVIVNTKAKLYLVFNKNENIELIPVSANRFMVEGFSPDVIYEFYVNPNGEVISLQVQQLETGTTSRAVKL